MGFSEVTSSLLMFVTAMAVTAGAIGYLALAVQDLAGAGAEVGRELATELRTAVQVINDPAAMPLAPVRVYVKNTGTEALDPNQTTLLVDGQVRSAATVSILNASDAGRWRPGEVVQVSDATLALLPGDHSLTVIVERGVRDSLKVRV